MLKSYRNNRGNLTLKEKSIFIGSLLLFFLGALLWYNYMHRTVVLTPEKLFEETFVEPVTSVRQLEGGNSQSFGNDFWIKFVSDTPVHLRNPQEFKTSVAEVGRRWFSEKYPADGCLRDAAVNYEFYMFNSSVVGKTTQGWFLTNKKRKRYFYRHWDM